MYYPSDLDFNSDETIETKAFWSDIDLLGPVSNSEDWHVTDEWATKFQLHLERLLPLAERGNVLAQYAVAAIYMLGCRYSTSEEHLANSEHDLVEMTKWLVRAARQGYLVAVDNLISAGYGSEAERVRSIYREIQEEIGKEHVPYPVGEVMRRAYGSAMPERRKK